MSDIEQSRATKITELHNQLEQLMRTTLDKAIEIGGLLAEQKAELPHGQWGQWVADNLPFSDRVARDYMRFYERRHELKTANLADLTEARKYIAGPETKAQTTKQSNPNSLGALLGDNPKVEVSEKGIQFKEPLTPDEFWDMVERVKPIVGSDAGSWILGDLLNHADLMRNKAEALQQATHRGDFDTVQEILDGDAEATQRLAGGIADEWPEDTEEQRQRKREWLQALSKSAERSAAQWAEIHLRGISGNE